MGAGLDTSVYWLRTGVLLVLVHLYILVLMDSVHMCVLVSVHKCMVSVHVCVLISVHVCWSQCVYGFRYMCVLDSIHICILILRHMYAGLGALYMCDLVLVYVFVLVSVQMCVLILVHVCGGLNTSVCWSLVCVFAPVHVLLIFMHVCAVLRGRSRSRAQPWRKQQHPYVRGLSSVSRPWTQHHQVLRVFVLSLHISSGCPGPMGAVSVVHAGFRT